MRLHTLEHVPFEGPAAITELAVMQGHTLTRSRLYAGDPLPALAEVDVLFVMGGPMSVHDEGQFPWMAAEKALLRAAVHAGTRMLGICLGAQLLAEVLGGQITRNPQREIGWFPVQLTPEGRQAPVLAGIPDTFPAFHWHGETFSIPEQAIRLASSEACANQAFAVGNRIVGLQFHLETTPLSMEQLLTHCADELSPAGPYIQSPGRMREQLAQTAATHPVLVQLFSNMIQE
ncbi:type 1 glutamine amidotransferase [Megalodesulfovibrio paquesii]